MTITEGMLLIQQLDPQAHLRMTTKSVLSDEPLWYVSAGIQVSDGALIRGAAQHRTHPTDAVTAYLDALRSIKASEVIVTDSLRDRHEWRWDGTGWAEVQSAA